MKIDIHSLYDLYKRFPTVTTDSRNCPKDAIFFALKGERFDGNAYAADALRNGCIYAVIDDPRYETERTFLVDDARLTLQDLAMLHRRTLAKPVLAITGTNGKTTTKELCAAVLGQSFNVLATEGNLNNAIGVPLTLLRMREEHEVAIIEMGASHPGDIRELVCIAQPDFALITNIGLAHLAGFGSLENVAKTKGELYDYIRENGGEIFLHANDERLWQMSTGLRRMTYGEAEGAAIIGRVVMANPFLKLEWRYWSDWYTVQTRLVGTYNLDNVLAAISVGLRFGIEIWRINKAIEEYVPRNNRSQFMRTDRNQVIADAYNANPTSMRAALENFAVLPEEKKAVILGDMLELGEASEEAHRAIVRLVDAGHYDRVYLCGKEFSRVAEGYPCYEDEEALAEALRRDALTGYTILLKGSRGIGLERVLPEL